MLYAKAGDIKTLLEHALNYVTHLHADSDMMVDHSTVISLGAWAQHDPTDHGKVHVVKTLNRIMGVTDA